MSDNFISNSLPPLRSEYKEALYQRISQLDEDIRDKRPSYFTGVKKHWKSLVVASLLVSVLILLGSEEARAKVITFLETFGIFHFEETDDFPFEEMSDVKVFDVATEYLSQIKESLSFELNIPEYIPEGYELDEEIGHASNYSWVSPSWSSPAGGSFLLLVQIADHYPEWAVPIGPGAVEEVRINEDHGVIVRGSWDFDKEVWNYERGLRLSWQKGDLVYSISSYTIVSDKGKPSDILTIEELIRIAESIP
jgi:hypothetical protein